MNIMKEKKIIHNFDFRKLLSHLSSFVNKHPTNIINQNFNLLWSAQFRSNF